MDIKLTGKKGLDTLKDIGVEKNLFQVIKKGSGSVVIDIPGYGKFQTKYFEEVPNQYLLLINELKQLEYQDPVQENQRLKQIILYYELYLQESPKLGRVRAEEPQRSRRNQFTPTYTSEGFKSDIVDSFVQKENNNSGYGTK